jgi:hypothetical protein
MEGESSATSENQLKYRLTAMLSATGRIPSTTCPVITRLLELHKESMDMGVWPCVLYKVHCGKGE